jgi:hypothetical protein
MNDPIHDVAVVGEHAYLLVGSGLGRLVIVDVSEPQNPIEVNPDGARPWGSRSLTVRNHYLYLAGHDLRDSEATGGLRILDISNPAYPVALGRYVGLTPGVLDVAAGGGHAYIASGCGLALVDVSNPSAPSGGGLYRANALPGTGTDVAVEGKIAYVAAGRAGLQIVDVADSVNPRVVDSHDTGGHAWAIALTEGKVPAHTYAYIADEYNGLRVIDVSDPPAPVEVGAYDLPGHSDFFHGVAIEGDYAYVADGGLMSTGLRVVDMSDPAHPLEVAFLPLTAGQEDTPPARVEDVAVADSYVYLAAGTTGLRVIDVSDPVAPVEIGFFDTAGRVDKVMVMGQKAYVADGDLRIVDVANPAAPAEVSFYDLPDLAATPHVTVQGSHAYLTGNGIRILDVSDPRAPVEVARHPIPQGNVAVVSDTVYVIGNGLFILRASPPVY